MINIRDMLEFNKRFVEDEAYRQYETTKLPSKQLAILSCMDTRLTELLPAALNLKNGDAKIIKNAGAIITHPFGSVMRSLLVAVYELNVRDIFVIGHYDCGVQGLDPSKLIDKMLQRNITQENLDNIKYYGIDIDNWLRGFDSVEASILGTVRMIKEHPLMPDDTGVYGFVMDPLTGKIMKL